MSLFLFYCCLYIFCTHCPRRTVFWPKTIPEARLVGRELRPVLGEDGVLVAEFEVWLRAISRQHSTSVLISSRQVVGPNPVSTNRLVIRSMKIMRSVHDHSNVFEDGEGELCRARSEGMISHEDIPYIAIVSVYPQIIKLRGGWWSTGSEY
jgi:hypothetical protein